MFLVKNGLWDLLDKFKWESLIRLKLRLLMFEYSFVGRNWELDTNERRADESLVGGTRLTFVTG